MIKLRSNHSIGLLLAKSLTLVGWIRVWIGPAISLVVLQLPASLALLRALHVILGWRPVLLIPLIFALFTPLGIPGFAWWAAALNSLPMLAALAWVTADAILLVRTGNIKDPVDVKSLVAPAPREAALKLVGK